MWQAAPNIPPINPNGLNYCSYINDYGCNCTTRGYSLGSELSDIRIGYGELFITI